LAEPVQSVKTVVVRGASAHDGTRAVPEETAVAIVLNGSTHAVMMATPADLEDFAVGFALSEGIVTAAGEIEGTEIVEQPQGIEARLWLPEDRAEAVAARRRAMAGPVGCGLCGIESLEEAVRPLPSVGDGAVLDAAEVDRAVAELTAAQSLYARTRAVHAAGLYLPGRGVVLAREDVGRHNALDKLAGAMARQGIDGGSAAIVITSRVSVEMVQKCAMAGVPVLIAVSAPTAHALRLAEASGITLAAIARGDGFEIFTHPKRIRRGEQTHVA
jgi:FdhD protein